MISWNYGQISISIARYWVNPVSEGIFWISCLSFELYSFYCVHNSTNSTVINIYKLLSRSIQLDHAITGTPSALIINGGLITIELYSLINASQCQHYIDNYSSPHYVPVKVDRDIHIHEHDGGIEIFETLVNLIWFCLFPIYFSNRPIFSEFHSCHCFYKEMDYTAGYFRGFFNNKPASHNLSIIYRIN